MIKFCLRPLLEYTLEKLLQHRITNIVLVTGLGDTELECFRAWGRERSANILVARRGLEFGSAGVVKDVADELQAEGLSLQGELLVVYGDSLLSIDFTGMLAAHRAYRNVGGLLTVACHQPEDLIVEGKTVSNYGILSLNAENRIEKFHEKPLVKEIFSAYASAGVFLIDWNAFALFPSRRPSDLSRDVISPATAEKPSPVFGFDIAPGYRYDIGTPADYMRRQFDVLNGLLLLENVAQPFTSERSPPFPCDLQGVTLIGDGCAIAGGVVLRGMNVIGEGVSIDKGSQIENSVILDNVQIGVGVRMSRTLVGPSSRIGDKLVLAEGSVIGGWSTIK